MSDMALINAVKDLSLPEQIVRAVVADYLDFLKDRQPKVFEKIDARLREDPSWFEALYEEAKNSMLGATLMLTLDKNVDIKALFEAAYGAQNDQDLLAMRKELVSRALIQTKDAADLAGLPMAVVKARKELFCQESKTS